MEIGEGVRAIQSDVGDMHERATSMRLLPIRVIDLVLIVLQMKSSAKC